MSQEDPSEISIGDYAIEVTEALVDAANKTKITASQLCALLLPNTTPVTTEVRARKAELVKYENFFYLKGGNPMFADTISYQKGDKTEILGHIHTVTTVPDSLEIRRITIIGDEKQLTDIPNGNEQDVTLKQFTLSKPRVSANCGPSQTQSKIIAKYVQNMNNDSIKKLYGGDWQNDVLPRVEDDESKVVSVFSDVFVEIMRKFMRTNNEHTECPEGSEDVSGVCMQIMERAAKFAGDIPLFDTYSKNLTSFRTSFESFVGDKQLADIFCASFTVTQKTYAEIHRESLGAWARLAEHMSQKNVKFAKQMHQVVFQSYISSINSIKANNEAMTQIQTAGLMWLLFFTQLPPITTKLTQKMAAEFTDKNIVSRFVDMVRQFHMELKTEILKFLPKRDWLMMQQDEDTAERKKKVSLYDFIREHFNQIESVLIAQVESAFVRLVS